MPGGLEQAFAPRVDAQGFLSYLGGLATSLMSPGAAEAKVIPGDLESMEVVDRLRNLAPALGDTPEIAEGKKRLRAILTYADRLPDIPVYSRNPADPDDPATGGYFTRTPTPHIMLQAPSGEQPHLLGHELMHYIHRSLGAPDLDSEQVVRGLVGNYLGDNPRRANATVGMTPAQSQRLMQMYLQIYPQYRVR